MIIKDPQNLLDLNAIPDRECLSGMILEIPSHGVPIHPTSINRFLEEAKVGQQLLMLQPKLPVSSQLGLPPYPILAYLYPQSLSQKLIPFFHLAIQIEPCGDVRLFPFPTTQGIP